MCLWFTTKHKRILLLFAIFCFSFLFRAVVVFYYQYPPGSDIGLHGSVINLILDEETLPTQNPYHMGGEPLSTPPGFHFFVSILILFTGMPIALAQLIIAAFFSSMMVFPAFLVSKRIWKSQNAGLLAAFFVSISALSIEMMTWGGYTNIVTLSLMAIIFYLFLKDNDRPNSKNLFMGTLFFGSLIITHTFSLSVFLPILASYLILLIVGRIAKLKEMKILNMLRFFAVSVTLGMALVSPWLLRVFNFFVGASSEGALTGGLDNRNLILANRTVDPLILILFVALIPTLFMLKDSRKKYVDATSLLLLAWFFAPLVLTQAHIFGIFTDYSRFAYFIDFPGTMIISAGLLYLARYITIATNMFIKIKWIKIKTVLTTIAFTVTIFLFIIVSIWSIFPSEGLKRTNFYTTVMQPEAETIEWIQNNTPEDAVLVADHLYGWWLSGIAKRPTLSAASLEFLIYSHELEVAKNAQLLFETNYFVDNGLIQIREDGPYLSRHNPEFGIEKLTGEYVGLLFFENNQTIIEYDQQNINLTQTNVTKSNLTQKEDLAVLTITSENEHFTINKTLQLQRGKKYAELAYLIESKNEVNDFDVKFKLFTAGNQNFTINDESSNIIDVLNSNNKVVGQLNFTEPYSQIEINETAKNYTEITYNAQNSIEIKMSVVIVDNEKPVEYSPEKLTSWDYKEMIEDYNVSYVVSRDKNANMKFAKDPLFRLVFNSGNVVVFQVVE